MGVGGPGLEATSGAASSPEPMNFALLMVTKMMYTANAFFVYFYT